MLNTKFVMSGVNILPSISLIVASSTAETGLKRSIFSIKTGKTCFFVVASKNGILKMWSLVISHPKYYNPKI